MISAKDEITLYGAMGAGILPLTGGPSTALLSAIAQTFPIGFMTYANNSPTSGQMLLMPIFIVTGQTITNINFCSGSTGSSSGTHFWYALYDDGRSSTTAGQLALLGQTYDQTGGSVMGTFTNLGLSLMVPVVTAYTGIYYVAFMCAASGMPQLKSTTLISTASIQIGSGTGAIFGATAGSSLTNMAPNPSGTITANNILAYAYVS
jgi:hypothetical protein